MRAKWGTVCKIVGAGVIIYIIFITDYFSTRNSGTHDVPATPQAWKDFVTPPHKFVVPAVIKQSPIAVLLDSRNSVVLLHKLLSPSTIPMNAVDGDGRRDNNRSNQRSKNNSGLITNLDVEEDRSKQPPLTTVPQNSTANGKARYKITYEPYGRLGNSMFQYAGLLGVAKMNNRIPIVRPDSMLALRFDGPFKLSHVESEPSIKFWKKIGEKKYAEYNPSFEHLPNENLYMQAYFQSYRYFQFISDEVKKEFRFTRYVHAMANSLLRGVRGYTVGRVTVGVHVRRGDLLTRKETECGSLTAPGSYFKKAFQWMREKYGDVVFLVVSDDMIWCETHIAQSKDLILMPPSQGFVHLCLLTKCNHVIMSVGTFGWWGGWLGGGDVIYYTHSLRVGSWKYERFNASDVFPPHWIGIGD